MPTKTLYKVLKDGRSFHGGSMAWPLPTGDQPGAWVEVEGPLAVCRRGLHLTTDPARWFAEGASVFAAEWEAEGGRAEDKVVVRRARLLWALRPVELVPLRIFLEGEHQIRDVMAWVGGSSSVEARGSSRVEARGSSRVEARGSSRVVAWDSSRVEAWGSSRVVARDSSSVVARDSSSVVAWGSSRVVAWGSSRVEAWGSSRVVAWDSSRVVAWDSSRVEAWGSSRVEAWDSSSVVARGSSSVVARDSSTVNGWSDRCQVSLAEKCVTIDRNTDPPTVRCGWLTPTPEPETSPAARGPEPAA